MYKISKRGKVWPMDHIYSSDIRLDDRSPEMPSDPMSG